MKAGVLIGHLQNKGNEGAIIRTAEVFGLNLVFVVGKREQTYYSSEGTERHMVFLEFENYEEVIGYIKKNKHKLVCVENINEGKNISEVKRYPVNPIFVSGNEKLGVPKELLKEASLIVKIPQGLGYANCLNTGNAMSIVIQDFFQKQINKRRELWEISHREKYGN